HEVFSTGSSGIVQIVEPSRNLIGINWRDIWKYRELLYFLTWRDVKIRYKQTVLGGASAVLQPVMSMAEFLLDEKRRPPAALSPHSRRSWPMGPGPPRIGGVGGAARGSAGYLPKLRSGPPPPPTPQIGG